MEEFIHRENLALFKKRLAETAHGRGAGSTHEIAGGRGGERTATAECAGALQLDF